MHAATIGLDLAKDVFEVHGVTEAGKVVFNRAIKRRHLLTFFKRTLPCVVGMEACGSAHHWARELTELGHDVKLMPAMYVKAYVKRGKTDAVDAEAICEAVRRPTMRFVEVKTIDQQAFLAVHRSRDLVVRQRTQLSNMLRSVLREFGQVLPTGIEAALAFAQRYLDGDREALPKMVRGTVGSLCDHLLALNQRVEVYTQLIEQHAFVDERCQRLVKIPGVGPITASAIVATVGDATQFRRGRDLAAWLGLTPLNRSSGGKEKLGRITKKGDRYLRKLLIVGMTSRALQARNHPDRADRWTAGILAEKPFRLAIVAMANKTARIIWALLAKGTNYRQPAI
ncbi:MAG: IS110 family transposase [Pseudomonadota bacterium]